MSLNEASILAVIGGTGSGKTAYIKQHIKRVRPSRLLIWDPMGEYHHQAQHGLRGVYFSTLSSMAIQRTAARVTLAYCPGRDVSGKPKLGYTAKQRATDFDLFCDIALDAGNMMIVVDELSLVTSPSWAPDPWGQVSNAGRHAGLQVIGASQRPAHIDKNFLGNATVIHCGTLGEPADAKTVAARVPGVSAEDIMSLAPLQWIEYVKATRALTRGTLKF